MSGDKVKQSLHQSLIELRAVIRSAYKLAPCGVVTLVALATGVVWIALQSEAAMTASLLLIVFFVSVLIYASTGNYGEASLALAAGLISVYSVEWTGARFTGFVAIWLGFSLLVLMMASVKLAANAETIYRQAAIAVSGKSKGIAAAESQLRVIGEKSKVRSLGPIERAEVVRLFAFRKVPIETMPSALEATETLSVITQLPCSTIAAHVADLCRIFEGRTGLGERSVADTLYRAVRECAVSPTDFFQGFESSRHLILSGSLAPADYFQMLRKALDAGVAPEKLGEHLASPGER